MNEESYRNREEVLTKKRNFVIEHENPFSSFQKSKISLRINYENTHYGVDDF